MAKYPPLFERIKLNEIKDGEKIATAQAEFEKFWRNVQKLCPSNSEKTLAMRKMQEACMWLCRGIALSTFAPDEPPKASLLIPDNVCILSGSDIAKPVLKLKSSKSKPSIPLC